MDELSRPPAPRSPWDRVLDALAAVTGSRPPTSRPRWLGIAAVVVLVAVGIGGWQLLRRPPDAVATLPRASDGAPTSVAGPRASTDPSSAPTTSARGADDGEGSGGPVVVHVAGAVVRPGVVTLPPGGRAVDAVAAAGGLAPGADPDRVNLAAPVQDGMRLVIPLVGQPAPVELPPELPGAAGAAGTQVPGGAPSGGTGAPVDLNTADAQLLDSLPGVGPSTAQAIIAHREEHGPFGSVEELLDVRGIGEAKLDALRDLVTAGS
jgi:competence protein ComEA